MIEKSGSLWGKAGQRSLARSASFEAAEQLTRALDQIASLPATPVLRREQIQLQVAIITPLMYVKGYVAPETQSAVERARLLIERAEELGETPEDPLLLFSVLYGCWTASHVDFNGEKMRDLAGQFLGLAEKQGSIAPLMVGHRLMGMSLLQTGDIAQGRAHFDRAIALVQSCGASSARHTFWSRFWRFHLIQSVMGAMDTWAIPRWLLRMRSAHCRTRAKLAKLLS